MSTHLIKPGQSVTVLRSRCGRLVAELPKQDFVGTEAGIDLVDCAGCLHDLILDTRLTALGPSLANTAEGRWLAGSDTGSSSITIWAVMTGHRRPRDHVPSEPHDAADFGRCHRLLKLFPAWRERLPEVSALYPEWVPLVDAWDELTALYLEELPSGRAPRLYARMVELTAPPQIKVRTDTPPQS